MKEMYDTVDNSNPFQIDFITITSYEAAMQQCLLPKECLFIALEWLTIVMGYWWTLGFNKSFQTRLAMIYAHGV